MKKILLSKWTKVPVFLLCLVPFGILVRRYLGSAFPDNFQPPNLGSNPIEFITHATGDWTLRFVVITLSITPLRKILKQPALIRFRRMLGLFAFFYGCLHFATWIGLDKFFDWTEMWKDVQKRRFITVGFLGFVLMIPLAITSTAGMIRRLGGKRWQQLHRLIYVTAVAGVVHYYWLVKSDVRKPLEYAFLVGILLTWRLGTWLINRRQQQAAKPASRPEPTTAEST